VLTTAAEAKSTSRVRSATVAQVEAVVKGAVFHPGFVARAVHTAHPEGASSAG